MAGPDDPDPVELADCNCFIGRMAGSRNAPARAVTATSLEEELARHGIRRGLVTHVASKEYHPSVGNGLLAEELPAGTRWRPCWTVLPHHTGEMAPPGRLVAELREAGAAAARIFPSFDLHRFVLAEWCVGPLLAALEAEGVPVLIDFNLFRRAEPDWRGLYDILEHHRALAAILINLQGRNNRSLFPLLEHFPNVYLELGAFDVHAGVEEVCRRFGASRLVFGSGYPYRPAGGVVLRLLRAGISPAERSQIGHGNLDRLLGGLGAGRGQRQRMR